MDSYRIVLRRGFEIGCSGRKEIDAMLALQHRTGSQLLLFVVLVSGLFLTGAVRDRLDDTSQPATTGWKIKFDESGSSPVIADGVLYVGSADGTVYALDPNTGEAKWRFHTGESLLPDTSGGQVITVPRDTSVADQMIVGMNAAEKQRGQGIRRVDMTPAVENGTVFVGSGDLSFYAIDAATGKKKWSYVAGSGMASNNNTSYPVAAAVLGNGTVYFATDDGLHALDAVTGKRKWLFETWKETPVFGVKRAPAGLVPGDGVIFLTAWANLDPNRQKSFLYAVDPESGKAKWVTGVGGWDTTAPAAAKGLAFFAVEDPGPTPTSSSDRETLYAANAADGRIQWKVGAEKKYGTARMLVAGNIIFFSTDKNLLALELGTGRQLWNFSADGISGGFFEGNPGLWADDQHLYLVTHKGSMMRPKDTLRALALSTGQEKWSQSLSGSVRVAMIHDGVVYAGGEHLHALDAATGKELWAYKGTGRESARLISGGRIFLTSPTVDYVGSKRVDQGYLYAIDSKTGKLKP